MYKKDKAVVWQWQIHCIFIVYWSNSAQLPGSVWKQNEDICFSVPRNIPENIKGKTCGQWPVVNGSHHMMFALPESVHQASTVLCHGVWKAPLMCIELSWSTQSCFVLHCLLPLFKHCWRRTLYRGGSRCLRLKYRITEPGRTWESVLLCVCTGRITWQRASSQECCHLLFVIVPSMPLSVCFQAWVGRPWQTSKVVCVLC